MGGRRKNHERNRVPPFVMLTHAMLKSAAFNDLKPSGRDVLLSIMAGQNGRNGTVDDPIVCTYKQMVGKHGPATIARALRDLEEHGFIERINCGGLEKNPNKYVLSEDWKGWKRA